MLFQVPGKLKPKSKACYNLKKRGTQFNKGVSKNLKAEVTKISTAENYIRPERARELGTNIAEISTR